MKANNIASQNKSKYNEVTKIKEKKDMKMMKKFSLLSLAFILACSIVGCQQIDASQEQKKFDEFIQQEFAKTMESDYITNHIYMQNPQTFGIDLNQIEVSLGTRPNSDGEILSTEDNDNTYHTFQQFHRDALTEEQKDIYDIYEYQASLSQKMNNEKFDYYGSYFESMSGIHFQLPTLFADWQVRNEKDVQDLITLLNDTSPYVESVLEYTKKQEENGLLMLDLESIIEYCDSILRPGENSAILASMSTRIEQLSLDAEKTEKYKSQLKEAFSSSFLPAFESIRSTMETFQQTGCNNTEGLAKFKYGKEYYELLLQQSIGSNKSVEDIRTMMEKAFNKHLYNCAKIAVKNPEAVEPLISNTLPKTGYFSYTDILDDIKNIISEEFPPVSNLNYHIENMNEELASNSGVTAYFNIPTLDGDSIKQLRVNPTSNDVSSIPTFSTVAHEGFPGHMYQYAYMYENVESNYIKALSNVSAYTEGYAVYAQYETLSYLDEVDQTLLQAYKENELATYCMMILADIGIHYDGWSVEDFKNFMEEKGFILDDESIKAQYAQLQANPTAFEPYYVGYHEIISMKEDVQQTLGRHFNEKEFHTALLESGTAPFPVVQQHIDAYVEKKK